MSDTERFPFLSRVLHWLMAILVLAMLFIGIAMVASVTDYAGLVAIHKPIGAAILVLVAIRLVNRLVNPPPPLPDWMPPWQRFVASAWFLGGALFRFDTYLVAFNPGPGWHYFPSVQEIFVTLGLVALEIAIYIALVRQFPLLGALPARPRAHQEERPWLSAS